MTTGTKFTAGNDSDPDADSINPMLVYADPDAGTAGDATVYWLDLPSSGPGTSGAASTIRGKQAATARTRSSSRSTTSSS
jgi:hypothetical protein